MYARSRRQKGYYNDTFKAIAADTGYLPHPEFISPNAESQPAMVISNSDPLNQGHVQVRFDWQMHNITEWIRVMTRDAGGGDKVSTNRGFMSIPEVGDQVMVGFQHQLPDRPFVMGSMFHGKVGGGGGSGNNVKSLSSKSGNIICLNDGAGIEIKDKAGNFLTLSGAGDVTTQVSNNNVETVGNEHTTNVAAKSSLNVGEGAEAKMSLDSSGNISIEGTTKIELKVGENSITITKEGITISSKAGMLDLNSTENAILVTKDKLSIHSQSIMSVNSSDSISITGSQVDIN